MLFVHPGVLALALDRRERPAVEDHWRAVLALVLSFSTPRTNLARELVRTLEQQVQADPGAASRREQAARECAAVQLEQRIQAALARLPELEEAKRRDGRSSSSSSGSSGRRALAARAGSRAGVA